MLITCFECGKQVTDTISKCIHCGKNPKGDYVKCNLCQENILKSKLKELDIKELFISEDSYSRLCYYYHPRCLLNFTKTYLNFDLEKLGWSWRCPECNIDIPKSFDPTSLLPYQLGGGGSLLPQKCSSCGYTLKSVIETPTRCDYCGLPIFKNIHRYCYITSIEKKEKSERYARKTLHHPSCTHSVKHDSKHIYRYYTGKIIDEEINPLKYRSYLFWILSLIILFFLFILSKSSC